MQMREVVIVEKEKDFALCLSEMFESYGIKTRRAGSYEELLGLIEGGSAQYVVCDLWKHPTTNSFLHRLAQLNSFPKIVFTSIYSDPEQWPDLKEYHGPSMFIAKPFRAQAMMNFLFTPESEAVGFTK